MTKRKAVVLDIDGVILKSSIIFKEIYDLQLRGDAVWDYFHEHCNSPRVVVLENIKPFIQSLGKDITVILSTARNEKCREATEKRLHEEGFHYEALYMRSRNDYRLSHEVKKDHLQEISKNYDIVAFVDDELLNCQMAEKEGILALRRV